AKDLKTNLGVVASDRTVCRTLNQVGLEAVPKQKQPRLSAKNIKEQLKFAKCHKDSG
ncbi:hypothetical protein EV182_007010, partial [Spiromyces aspiralis]